MKKISKALRILLSILLFLGYILISFMTYKIDILETGILVAALVIFLILVILLSVLLLTKKMKLLLRTIVVILSLIITSSFFLGGIYIYKTYDFLEKIGVKHTISDTYYILADKYSEYNKISDLENKKIGIYDEELNIFDKAIILLNKKIENENIEYNSIQELADALIYEEVDAIMISESHKKILEESNEEFKGLIKELYKLKVSIKDVSKEEHEDEKISINLADEPFTIFISGNDSSGEIDSRGRSDVNMIATINPKNHEVLLVSIPRDYYVQLHGKNGSKDKLTHAGIYGIDMSVSTVEDLLDIDIDYYVKLNFSTLINLVDAIDGIEVYSDKSFRAWTNHDVYITEGMVHMDGATALAFARERYTYKEGDRHRIQNQQDVMEAIIKKLTTTPSLLTKYSKILDKLSTSFETNLETKNITKLVKSQLASMSSWTIERYNLNGSDAYGVCYSMGQQELYVMEPYTNTVNNAKSYINDMVAGKSLSELEIENEVISEAKNEKE